MNNTFPFSFLESLANRFQPPSWVVDEGQQRLVLFLNHVLMQEKAAQDRLARQKGRVVHLRVGLFAIDLLVTPAGLLDRAPPGAKAPAVTIEGDVQLAAEVGWLADNLRWDVEEDLSRVIGDAPAHALADAARRLVGGLRQFLARSPQAAPTTTTQAAQGASATPPAVSSAPSPVKAAE
ncbi:MAG: hypothetical protein B7X59_12615 [Polaromonas sp. 39-63-203]|nr:MAG: hypothetical protein B7X59_12615 [Polaromonas sp. 39-63-203]